MHSTTAHLGRRGHPSAATESSRLLLAWRYLQWARSIPSIPRECCECTVLFLSLVTLTFDFWPWCSNSSERRTKHDFRVNLAQIRSAVPVIHCGMRVPIRKACCRFRPISSLKLVATATCLDRSRNQYQIEHLQPHVSRPWKFGEDLFARSDC